MAAPADAGAHAAPADHDRRRLGWFGLGAAAASFLCGLFSASVLGAAYAVARGLDQAEAKEDFGFAVVTSMGLWVGFLVLPLIWARMAPRSGRLGPAGDGAAAHHLGLRARWVDLPLGIAVGLGSTLATGVVSAALLTTSQQDALEAKAEEVIDRAQGPAAVVLLVVVLCAVTPLAEEVFFRGLLFRSLARVSRLVIALVVGGLIFGLVHYDGASTSGIVVLVQIGMLSLFGVALCALTHRTERLGAAIVAHATFNAVTVVTLLAQR